jgi:hypothetical protein
MTTFANAVARVAADVVVSHETRRAPDPDRSSR